MISYIAQNSTNGSRFVHYELIKTLVPGGRLNNKDGLTRYGDSHVKDKTS